MFYILKIINNSEMGIAAAVRKCLDIFVKVSVFEAQNKSPDNKHLFLQLLKTSEMFQTMRWELCERDFS